MTDTKLDIFVAGVPNGWIGYVRIPGGRILRYTMVHQSREMARQDAEMIKKILEEHPTWWD